MSRTSSVSVDSIGSSEGFEGDLALAGEHGGVDEGVVVVQAVEAVHAFGAAEGQVFVVSVDGGRVGGDGVDVVAEAGMDCLHGVAVGVVDGGVIRAGVRGGKAHLHGSDEGPLHKGDRGGLEESVGMVNGFVARLHGALKVEGSKSHPALL